MFIQIPAPVPLRNIVTGEVYTDETVIDGETGKSFKQLGRPYKNEPIPMRTWFLRFMAPLFKGYTEFRASRRIEKLLQKAEKERVGGAVVVGDIGKDDAELWKQKLEELPNGSDFFMQLADFSDAIGAITEERPEQRPASKAVTEATSST